MPDPKGRFDSFDRLNYRNDLNDRILLLRQPHLFTKTLYSMNMRVLKTVCIFLLILFTVLLASGQRHKKKPLPKKKVVIVEAIKYKPLGDQGNGTFLNPVLPGDYSDLDAIRVGTDYYAM